MPCLQPFLRWRRQMFFNVFAQIDVDLSGLPSVLYEVLGVKGKDPRLGHVHVLPSCQREV